MKLENWQLAYARYIYEQSRIMFLNEENQQSILSFDEYKSALQPIFFMGSCAEQFKTAFELGYNLGYDDAL